MVYLKKKKKKDCRINPLGGIFALRLEFARALTHGVGGGGQKRTNTAISPRRENAATGMTPASSPGCAVATETALNDERHCRPTFVIPPRQPPTTSGSPKSCWE